MSDNEEEEMTFEEYVEKKLEGTDDKLSAIIILLSIIAIELFFVLWAINKMFPDVWRI